MNHPGDLVIKSPVLIGVAVVVLNDHVLKDRYGNWFTGKLSDAAGVFVFPLVALSVLEIVRWGLRRSPWHVSGHEAAAAVIITGIGFAAVKTCGLVADAYAATIGAIRWLSRYLTDSGRPYAPIEVTHDWTDLMVLPILVGSWMFARDRSRSVSTVKAGIA